MSDCECGFGTERCAAISRTVVAAGVVVITGLLVALVILFVPGWKTWRAAAAQDARKVELVQVYKAAGDAAFAAGNFDDALSSYILAASTRPSDPDVGALVSRARIASMASNPSTVDGVDPIQVRNEAMLVATMFPTDMVNVTVVRAMLKFRESRLPEAMALLEEAFALDGASASVHLARALLWKFVPEKGPLVGAEYDAAVAARPEDALVLGLAGQYFMSAPDSAAKGLDLLKKASSKISNVAWLKTLATAALQSGAAEEAQKYIQEAYALAPREPEVMNLFGQMLMGGREYQKAAQLFAESLAIKDSRDTLFQLGVAYNALGRFDQALPILAKVNQSGSDVMTLFEYANALAGFGRRDEALKLYGSIMAVPSEGAEGVQAQIITTIKERAAQAVARIGAPASGK